MLQAPLCGQHEEGSNLGTLSDVESENQLRYCIHLIFKPLITLCVSRTWPMCILKVPENSNCVPSKMLFPDRERCLCS